MISKASFLKAIHFLIKEEEKQEKLDKALKKYTSSDSTGFSKPDISIFLLDFLRAEMNDTEDYLSWWLYECPKRGKCKDDKLCTIWLGDIDDPNSEKIIVRDPEDLYYLLLINSTRTPSKESLQMAIKAQDAGVKFTLKEIQLLQDKNKTTKNEGWQDRDTLFQYIKTQIENQYRFERGIGADLDFQKPFGIINLLEEES